MIRPSCLVVLAAAVAVLGCGGTTDTEGHGRIRIDVTTSGADPQSQQYLLTLDGSRPVSIDPNGFTIYDAVDVGTHVVHLFALADNCAVTGNSSPRSVSVTGGDLAEITFNVVCSAPVTGGFRIVVSSSGSLTDADGYQLSVAGTPLRTIEVNAEELYEGLDPGVHIVTLKDVADFCQVIDANPQPYTVVPGKTVRITLRVQCGVPSGPND